MQLRNMVRAFVQSDVDPQALQFNRQKFNRQLFRKCGELGLLGVTAQEQHGGSGMDAAAAVIVHEELAASDPAFCLSYLAHSMLFVNNLAQNGSEAQRARFLPAACSGDAVCGMGMSEPGSGTDVLGMSTTAVAAPGDSGSGSGSGGGGYVLNGSKMWITNGTVDGRDTGDAFLVYARTGRGPRDISTFIVERGMAGFSLGTKVEDKCGMRASMTAELVFEDVRVPRENLVGEEGGALLSMVKNLEIERLALGAISLGIARRCIDIMNKYSMERVAFGKPISSYGQVQRHIAESYAEYMAGRAYTYSIAANLDLTTHGCGLDTDAVKLYTATMGKNVADRAMQVLGGNGYVGDYQVERLWRDAKLMEIGGGTLEAHHKNIVRDLRRLQVLP
ncbi:isovaleryl-CoA dehydrogenase [Tribonema minus]|uniref:Isovaleryl-CoA dehydrogenase n=1 Tax=Tribonema minus TaxID=303371 RepID=A0A835YPS6_9STRA|nr:isovaleryl-CoA dehydrogenase [Tribonema minus]